MTVYGSRNWEYGLLDLCTELEAESWMLSCNSQDLVAFFYQLYFPKQCHQLGMTGKCMGTWVVFHTQIIRAKVQLLSLAAAGLPPALDEPQTLCSLSYMRSDMLFSVAHVTLQYRR